MRGNSIIFYSLLGAVVAGDALAAIRVGNLSRNYAGTYKNVVGLEQQYYNSIADTTVNATEQDLPVPVANAELADKIRAGDSGANTDIDTLNKCAMIYPDGEFVWDRPTIGRGAGGAPTCVAVVEMRALGANGGLEYTTVARGKLAAGDIFKCNISDFPSGTYLPEITMVTFPSDNAPTREDVISVLNEEQKNKAGLKIAAAAVAAGIAGNIVGKSEVGNDSLFGTNSEKLKTTAAGALSGAALMTASVYSGKVPGDVILHAGVNAAAGGIIGNMMASGDSVLRIEKCKYEGIETTCLWGNIVKTDKKNTPNNVYYDFNSDEIIVCNDDNKECKTDNTLIRKSYVGRDGGAVLPYSVKSQNDLNDKVDTAYVLGDDKEMRPTTATSGRFYKINAEKRSGAPLPAVIVNFKDSAFGIKFKDWDKWRDVNGTTATVCLRDSRGDPYKCDAKNTDGTQAYAINDFYPISMDADDGGVVDFSNKARLGSTLKGAGAGGIIGGFSGYQGAQNDIEERFVQATREYNDSLEKFYCGTGRKFLSFYNDELIIPTISK